MPTALGSSSPPCMLTGTFTRRRGASTPRCPSQVRSAPAIAASTTSLTVVPSPAAARMCLKSSSDADTKATAPMGADRHGERRVVAASPAQRAHEHAWRRAAQPARRAQVAAQRARRSARGPQAVAARPTRAARPSPGAGAGVHAVGLGRGRVRLLVPEQRRADPQRGDPVGHGVVEEQDVGDAARPRGPRSRRSATAGDRAAAAAAKRPRDQLAQPRVGHRAVDVHARPRGAATSKSRVVDPRRRRQAQRRRREPLADARDPAGARGDRRAQRRHDVVDARWTLGDDRLAGVPGDRAATPARGCARPARSTGRAASAAPRP